MNLQMVMINALPRNPRNVRQPMYTNIDLASEISGEMTFEFEWTPRSIADVEHTFGQRTRTIAQFCGDMEMAKGPTRSLLEHYRDGHRHPHDYKLPLNLWETTPD